MGTITNESSCIVQSRWEWHSSDAQGRWGTEFQAYRYRQMFIADGDPASVTFGTSVITTKNKIRGKGRAISFRFRTEPAKDCRILGWNMEVAVNREP